MLTSALNRHTDRVLQESFDNLASSRFLTASKQRNPGLGFAATSTGLEAAAVLLSESITAGGVSGAPRVVGGVTGTGVGGTGVGASSSGSGGAGATLAAKDSAGASPWDAGSVASSFAGSGRGRSEASSHKQAVLAHAH